MEFKLLSEINYDINGGNMIDLPHDVLEKLNSKKLSLPYFFEIKSQSSLMSYVGVREFTAEADTVKLPLWLNEQLGINDGNQIIEVKPIKNIPKGKYVKLKPNSEDFFQVPDYESCLETKLSDFPLLYQGQIIEIEIFDKKYLITIEEIEQDWEDFDFDSDLSSLELNVINVINVDLEVDINNVFLKKKLEEERDKKAEEERKRKQEIDIFNFQNRELQKARITEETTKEKKPFDGNGNKLSEESNEGMSKEEIRKARLNFFKKNA